MVPNSTGGNAYPVDDMTRLRRFLILGSEGGSYYAGERKLTVENTAAVKRCIESNGMEAVEEIASISVSGRASKPRSGPVRLGDGRVLRHRNGVVGCVEEPAHRRPDGQPPLDVHRLHRHDARLGTWAS